MIELRRQESVIVKFNVFVAFHKASFLITENIT